MTDLHTHILPAMDDGSRSVAESLQMLAMEQAQGVDRVYLTPHFYPEQEEPQSFLHRRQGAFDALRRELPDHGPQLYLGGEIAWFPTIARCSGLEQMCLGDSRYFLLELPFQPWNGRLLDLLYRLPEQTGLIPVLAHVERYLPIQDKGIMKELFAIGLPMQMNASDLLARRFRLLPLLKKGGWVLGSDCHNMTTRPPDLGKAAAMLQKKMKDQVDEMFTWMPSE